MGREKTHKSRKHQHRAESPPKRHRTSRSKASKKSPVQRTPMKHPATYSYTSKHVHKPEHRYKLSKHAEDKERDLSKKSEEEQEPPSPPRKSKKYSKVEKEVTDANPSQRRKPKLPVLQTESPMERKAIRTKNTVSAASILKKKGKVDFRKDRKHKEPSPKMLVKSELLIDFEEGIEQARHAISKNLNGAFECVYNKLMEKLNHARASDEAFLNELKLSLHNLTTPLAEEKVSTVFMRDGKSITERSHMGKRMEQFKKSVMKHKDKLEANWKAWDELQDEFVQLGLEVFGAGAFSEHADEEERQTGFKRDMELFGLEHNARIKEMMGEIEDTQKYALETLDAAEMEATAALKNKQVRLLRAAFDM